MALAAVYANIWIVIICLQYLAVNREFCSNCRFHHQRNKLPSQTTYQPPAKSEGTDPKVLKIESIRISSRIRFWYCGKKAARSLVHGYIGRDPLCKYIPTSPGSSLHRPHPATLARNLTFMLFLAAYNKSSNGFSITFLNSLIHSPPTAPSTTL